MDSGFGFPLGWEGVGSEVGRPIGWVGLVLGVVEGEGSTVAQ